MKWNCNPVRSKEPITGSDLKVLSRIARKDREAFFQRYPDWFKLYSNRLLCVALCQGAALHFVDGLNGVKDFDVWSFFRENPGKPAIPYRRIVSQPFEYSKSGTSPIIREFIGRKVDLLFRSIPCSSDACPIVSIQHYLTERRTQAARCLAEKAVVLIEPFQATVVWPK